MIQNERARDLPRKEYFKGGHTLCPGCPGGIVWRVVTKIMGENSISALGATCISLPPAIFPSVLDIPSIYVSMATPAPLISGVSAALRILKRKGKLAKDEKINVFAMAGDGGTADIGFAGLSGAAERNDDGTYFCFDNEAYMNTGIQRSSLTPEKAWTTSTLEGKGQPKKNLPLIMAAHGIPYVATACPSYPIDLINKAKKAANTKGPAYLHILSVCPTGWRSPTEMSIRLGRLAAETGVFPLYEVVNGRCRITVDFPQLRPVKDYFKYQGRFRHLTPEMIAQIEERVHREYQALKEKCQ